MKMCQHFNHTSSPAVHGNVPAFSLHRCADSAQKCASIIHKYTGSAQKWASIIHKCAGSAQKCASIIHKFAGCAQKRASIIHKFAGFAQKCASNIHKCGSSAQKCARKPKVLNYRRVIVSQQETRGFGDLHPPQRAWRKVLVEWHKPPTPPKHSHPPFSKLLLHC